MRSTDPHHQCSRLALGSLYDSLAAVLVWVVFAAVILPPGSAAVIGGTISILVTNLAKALLAWRYRSGRVGHRGRWIRGFGIASLLASLAWGSAAAVAIIAGLAGDSATVLLMALMAVGLLATAALGTHRVLHGFYVAVLLLPVVVALVVRGDFLTLLVLLLDGVLLGVLGVVISGQYQALRTVSDTDSLTGLPNSQRFHRALHDELKRSRRSGDPLTVIVVDVDHFTLYNDHYGYSRGDQVLGIVGERVRQCLRRAQDLTAHMDAARFACLLPDCSREGAFMLADSIREGVAALELTHLFSPTSPRVTVSLGVVTWLAQGECEAGDLMSLAGAKLLESKENGRDQVTFTTID